MMNCSRRDFIKQAGLWYGSILLYASCSKNTTQYQVFTDEEAACLIALCEQVIPADHDAGATDAGVIRFIDRQTSLRFPDDLQVFRKGIAALQAVCSATYNKRFEQLGQDHQNELMKSMEQGRLAETYWTEIRQQSFFSLVLNRTMQGFYGSPRHGGNRNYVSYRMLKLDYPLLVGQNRYGDGK